MKIEFVTHSSQDGGTGTQHRAMWGSSRTGPEAEGIGEKLKNMDKKCIINPALYQSSRSKLLSGYHESAFVFLKLKNK